MKLRTYQEARAYLEEFISLTIYQKVQKNKALQDPLDRMRVLLRLLDNPETSFPSVLIGGTSGKGSTSHVTAHLLTTAGYKTGLFVKPHLQKLNERMQINNHAISDDDFLRILNTIVPAIDKMDTMPVGKPSYLEITFAMCMVYFRECKVDIAVVEVGMGGEIDATNTLQPLVTVLTNVSLDHTEFLGDTVEKIAQTKSGIIKKYQISNFKFHLSDGKLPSEPIVVTGAKQPSVQEIFARKARGVGSPFFLLGREFKITMHTMTKEGSIFDFMTKKQTMKNLHLALIGAHQGENAALALQTVLLLDQFGFHITESHIRKALQTVFVPGRFELIAYHIQNTAYQILLDGAHNPEKMHAFVEALQTLFPEQKKIFLLSFKYTKDIAGMLAEIVPVADAFVITEFQAASDMAKNAAMDRELVIAAIKQLQPNTKTPVFSLLTAKEALAQCFELSDTNTVIIATGSMYFVGEIRDLVIAQQQ